MMETRVCRHCLLADMEDERALRDSITERIRLLPGDERAEDAEYTRRLTLCRACDQLNAGTCAQCGCYVELRAARRGMHCPHVCPKW